MSIWDIFTYIDWIIFILVALTVFYLGIFAITSLFPRHSETPKAKNENRFIILIPTYKNGKSVMMTVKSVLGQSYPMRQFDVTVIADKEDEMTLFHFWNESNPGSQTIVQSRHGDCSFKRGF